MHIPYNMIRTIYSILAGATLLLRGTPWKLQLAIYQHKV